MVNKIARMTAVENEAIERMKENKPIYNRDVYELVDELARRMNKAFPKGYDRDESRLIMPDEKINEDHRFVKVICTAVPDMRGGDEIHVGPIYSTRREADKFEVPPARWIGEAVENYAYFSSRDAEGNRYHEFTLFYEAVTNKDIARREKAEKEAVWKAEEEQRRKEEQAELQRIAAEIEAERKIKQARAKNYPEGW